MWVLRIKYNPDGNIETYRARLVIKGCFQRLDIDYDRTVCPVIRSEVIRSLVAIAAIEGMIL